MQGADHTPTGLHCSLRVLITWLLSRLGSTTLLVELKLAFRLLLLLPIVTRPIGGTHELFALLLSLPVAFFQLLLTSHDEREGLPLVVHVVVCGGSCVPLALFSPLARPPNADNDAEEAEQAEDHTH